MMNECLRAAPSQSLLPVIATVAYAALRATGHDLPATYLVGVWVGCLIGHILYWWLIAPRMTK